jgi:antirestriction protein
MRVYIASLSDYNDGRLEGKWFDLSDYSDASDLMSDINDMLNELTDKYDDGEVREEWAVHDYEDIPPTLASEYMGEADFQQLIDIREFAEENNIPVEVLVERAGDTGSDDYQALAESLMFVVDGNDESDIVYEYESQIGELGNEFWSNHIYVDDVTERVIYGEDVDNFRQEILDENPDMDEDEAERQAEERADEEAERREDLATYLEEMGYGDEIPSWVSKDYEGAWKRSLSYDFDVIHHDGEMYVFSNNYALGGTILSGMVGAYIGYKYAESKRTGKKLFAKGGGVSKFPVAIERRINEINELLPRVKDADEIAGGYFGSTHYTYVQLTKPIEIKGKYVYIHSANGRHDMTFEKRYNVNKLGDEFDGRKALNYDLSKILKAFKSVLKDKYEKGGSIGFKELSAKVAKRYEGKKPEAKYRGEYGKRYSKSEAKEVGDKVAGKIYWQQRGRKFEEGGVIGQEIVFDDNGEENTGVIKDIHEITGDYIVKTDDGRVVLAQLDRDVISLGKMRETPVAKKRFGFFEDGGNVKEGNKYEVTLRNDEHYGEVGVSLHGWSLDNRGTYYLTLKFPNGSTSTYGQGEVKNYKSRYAEGGSVSGLDDLIRG